LKKPQKRDNTVNDKKVEKMNQYLHDLEEGFFKHVADDNDSLQQIKKRGNDGSAENGHV
jgi:hypothetical protein